MSKVVAFVPVKLNNERLPGKNTKKFSNGIPLINYILNTMVRSKKIDEIYVYCSNEAIVDYLPEGVTYLKRSENLDLDSTKINEVMHSFMMDVDADYYVLAHATAPFLKLESIDSAIDAVILDGYDSALTVEAKKEFLWSGNLEPNYNPKSIPRTQDLEPFYIETTGLYVYAKELILQNRRVGDKPKLITVSKLEAVDINEPDDFIFADALVSKGLLENDKC